MTAAQIIQNENTSFIDYNDVKHITLEEYYSNSALSVNAFRNKYMFGDDKTPADVFWRVAVYIASAEKTEELRKYWAARWFSEMWRGEWMPGGSILQGSANPANVSMSNCTHIGFENDTLKAIYETEYKVAKCAAHRQGLGIHFNLRPSGMKVNNSSKYSQGNTHWMNKMNTVGTFVGQKGRIPALLMSISDSNPDLIKFITVKSDQSTIDNANISVHWSDAFMKCLERDGIWKMRYEADTGEILEVEEKASVIFDLFVSNNWSFAEPGAQFIDVAKKYSNSNYLGDERFCIRGTNACSEQYLEYSHNQSAGLCVLASTNFMYLYRKFKDNMEDAKNYLRYELAPSIQRFQDNVVSKEIEDKRYAIEEQYHSLINLRRVGIGITNLDGYLIYNGIGYDTDRGIDTIYKLMDSLNAGLYETSIKLGEEKGSFLAFDREKFIQAPFIKQMMKRHKLEFNTMRNVTCSSIAPTGCIEENTRIITNKGNIKIKDLISNIPDVKEFNYDIPDITVYTENGPSKVTAFYNNGVIDGYVFKLSDGRTEKVSETHRFRVLDSEGYKWKYAPDIQIGDILVAVYDSVDLSPTSYIELNAIPSSDHFNLKDINIPEKLNETFSELLGWFYGDGSIKFRSNGKTDGLRFPIFEEDTDLIDHLNSISKILFNREFTIIKSKNKRMYECSLNSIVLSNFFIQNKFYKKLEKTDVSIAKNHEYRVPEAIFQSPNSVIFAFLRGLFEADGSITKYSISLSNKHLLFLEDIQLLLNKVGIRSTIRRNTSEKRFGKSLYILNLHYKYDKLRFKEKIRFISNRKNKRLDEYSFSTDREKIYLPLFMKKELLQKLGKKIIELGFSKVDDHGIMKAFRVSVQEVKNDKIWITRDLLIRIENLLEESINNIMGIPFNFETIDIINIEKDRFQTYDIEVEDASHSYINMNRVINHNTLSLLFKDLVSYGIEPILGLYYWKRHRTAGKWQWTFSVAPFVNEILKEKGIDIGMEGNSIDDDDNGSKGEKIASMIDKYFPKEEFKPAHLIDPFKKLELMSKLTKHCVDSSISVTYNLPEDVSKDTIKQLYIEAWKKEVKSISVYRDKSRIAVVEFESPRIASKRFTETETVKESNTQQRVKREAELFCDVYHVNIKGDKWISFVGIDNNDNSPYEIFAGLEDEICIPKKYKKGKILKQKNKYYFISGEQNDEDYIKVCITGSFKNDEHSALTRQISLSLRHKIPLAFIIDQLDKSNGTVVEFSKVLMRVLKNYLNEENVRGKVKCKECKSENVTIVENCIVCLDCGSGKC